MKTTRTLNETQFRDLRIQLKAVLNLDDVALECGEVIALKPKDGGFPITSGNSFIARYRANGEAEHTKATYPRHNVLLRICATRKPWSCLRTA